MLLATLQKPDKVVDNKLALFHPHPWPGEVRWPVLPSAHPCLGDVCLRSFEVEVVCHHGNWHKLGDKVLGVLAPMRIKEQEFVTCLPDPLPQNPHPVRRFGRVSKVEGCDGTELRQRGMQNRIESTNPVSIRVMLEYSAFEP